jgi:hypothetical protein
MLTAIPFFVLSVASLSTANDNKWTLQVEGGSAWTNRNDVRVPGTTGTRFSLKDLTGSGPFTFQRWDIAYRQNHDTEWRFLYAPFESGGTGTLNGPTNFRGTTFNAGAASAFYKFNSYRITYRRKWKRSEKSEWFFGYTLKVRNAEIQLNQGATSARESDPAGIVPLIHLSGREQLNDRWYASFDFDGLAGGPGRAFDIGARLHYQTSEDMSVFLGLRTLEGGANVPRVFSFAWVNYASIGITKRF